MSNKGIFTVDVGAVMAIIDKWMISYDHIGTGSSRSGQISEREWEEDRAKLLELLAATPAHDQPSRDVVDEDVVMQAERAFWPAYNEALRVHGTKADCHAIGMRAALQAAALPAVPKADEVDVDAVMAIIDKWMIYYDHIGTGSTRLGQISEREWEEDRAKLLELLAATPAHDQPEGSDND